MTRDDIIRMAREATEHLSDADSVRLQGIVLLALDAGEQAEREACVNIIETHQIPVGNSTAGELACQWTYDALHQIRDEVRARGEKK